MLVRDGLARLAGNDSVESAIVREDAHALDPRGAKN
jgi:hypothetical protein